MFTPFQQELVQRKAAHATARLEDLKVEQFAKARRRKAALQQVLNLEPQFKNNCFTEMRCGSEEGSCLRLIDGCITQLLARE